MAACLSCTGSAVPHEAMAGGPVLAAPVQAARRLPKPPPSQHPTLAWVANATGLSASSRAAQHLAAADGRSRAALAQAARRPAMPPPSQPQPAGYWASRADPCGARPQQALTDGCETGLAAGRPTKPQPRHVRVSR